MRVSGTSLLVLQVCKAEGLQQPSPQSLKQAFMSLGPIREIQQVSLSSDLRAISPAPSMRLKPAGACSGQVIRYSIAYALEIMFAVSTVSTLLESCWVACPPGRSCGIAAKTSWQRGPDPIQHIEAVAKIQAATTTTTTNNTSTNPMSLTWQLNPERRPAEPEPFKTHKFLNTKWKSRDLAPLRKPHIH